MLQNAATSLESGVPCDPPGAPDIGLELSFGVAADGLQPIPEAAQQDSCPGVCLLQLRS